MGFADMARKVLREGAKKDPAFIPLKAPSLSCFDPDSLLSEAINEAIAQGWTDDRLMEYIEALREAGALQAPWGFKVKESPLIGDYWIISGTTARGQIPVGDFSFTLDELRPIVDAFSVFKGTKIVRVKTYPSGSFTASGQVAGYKTISETRLA